jgi:alanine racemase
MVRPGCALYGVREGANLDLKDVIKLKSKILQIRKIEEDGFVGYGAVKKVFSGAKLAVVPVGYADGYLRSLSEKSFAFFKGNRLPIMGRVSMDLIIFDISNIADNEINVGDEIEIIGDNLNVDDIAKISGTIGYEILTSLGQRYNRTYIY